MAFINYSQIVDDAVALLVANVTSFEKVGRNMATRDYVSSHMPMADVRIRRVIPALVSQQQYYVQVQLEIEICVEDLTSMDAAATIRDGLVSSVQDTFRLNPRFSSGVDATILGEVDLTTDEDKDQGGAVSAALVQVSVFCNI